MKFSARTGWDRTENELSRVVAAARRRADEAGRPFLDLTESNPTRCDLFDARPLVAELGDPRGALYEPNPLGHASAREAVARYYARRGAAVAVEDILLSASTSESYGWIFKLLCDPGDEVLVATPSYPLFSFLAELEGVTLTPFRLDAERAWAVDRDDLEAAIGARTRAILLVHPNNPTGSFVSGSDRAMILELAAAHGIAVVVDEVFLDYAFDEARSEAPPTFARQPSGAGAPSTARPLTFVLSGLSKVVGLPQLKLGWLVVSGDPDDVNEARARLELVADSYLSVSTPVQLAAPAILDAQPHLVRAVRARTLVNLEAIDRALATPEGRASGLTRRPVEAGWYAVLALSPDRDDDDAIVAELAREDLVLVHPGFFFDFEEEGLLIVSLLPRPEVFAAGMSAIVRRATARPSRARGATSPREA